MEEIFEYYRDLERKVTQALSSGENIGRIVEITSKHFHSTVFFHDKYYHILASTNFLQRAANIQYNGRKGVYVQDAPYIAGILSLLGSDFSRFSIYSICATLKERVEGSYTCYHKGYIYLLVNLSASRLTAPDLRMRMAYIIREGLMHMGVSNIFQDFFQFPVYFRQAAITLRYREKSAFTVWYSEFCSYALKYWLTEGIGSLTKESILPSELSLLQAYDRKNNTNLFQTLQIYLETERNSTLTSQLLGIHRSTLPSRLYRIQQLTNLNLDEAETRLYLLNGFYALKNL